MNEKKGHGERLRTFTEKFGGITRLAEKINISQPRLSQYISEVRDLNSELLIELVKLGCDINWLLGSSAKAIIKEPKLEYRVKELEEENKELELQNEQLRKSIEAASGVLNYKVKNKRRRK